MITATAIGRLTDTPNLRYLEDGTPVANFSLATDDRNREDTTFLRVAIWGKAGEAAAKHLVKGQRIAASGRIEARSWTDDEGTRRQIWTLTADATEWLDKPRSTQPEHSEPPRRAEAQEAAETGEEPL